MFLNSNYLTGYYDGINITISDNLTFLFLVKRDDTPSNFIKVKEKIKKKKLNMDIPIHAQSSST